MGKILHDSVGYLGILSSILMLFNLIGIWVFKQEVFVEQTTLSPVEILMIFGFGITLIFNLASFIWGYIQLRKPGKSKFLDKVILILAVACVFLLWGDKVLADEIAREIRLAWEVVGEWTILYSFMTIQLIYNLLTLYRWIIFKQKVNQ